MAAAHGHAEAVAGAPRRGGGNFAARCDRGKTAAEYAARKAGDRARRAHQPRRRIQRGGHGRRGRRRGPGRAGGARPRRSVRSGNLQLEAKRRADSTDVIGFSNASPPRRKRRASETVGRSKEEFTRGCVRKAASETGVGGGEEGDRLEEEENPGGEHFDLRRRARRGGGRRVERAKRPKLGKNPLDTEFVPPTSRAKRV